MKYHKRLCAAEATLLVVGSATTCSKCGYPLEAIRKRIVLLSGNDLGRCPECLAALDLSQGGKPFVAGKIILLE